MTEPQHELGQPTQNAVNEYIRRLRPDVLELNKQVWVPTSDTEGNYYSKSNGSWDTDRHKAAYDSVLFRDEFKFIEPAVRIVGTGLLATRIKDEQRRVEGWSREDFFEAGRVVVDLGSGEAVALLDYSQEFPETTFIGVDSGYVNAPEIDFKKKGVQLVRDSWSSLGHFPDNSVDTLLSVQGGLTWAMKRDEEERSGDPDSFLRAITRVTKPGGVFLTDAFYPYEQAPEKTHPRSNPTDGMDTLKLFRKFGWERITLNKSGFFVLTDM